MLAVPVLRLRVAPVLNWCSRVLIIPENVSDSPERQEVAVGRLDSFELLRLLKAKGVTTLICGALTPDLLRYGVHLGLIFFHGIAGNVEEVLSAHREQRLDQPQFRLPGCRNMCAYEQRRRGKRQNSPVCTAPPGTDNFVYGSSATPGPVCICPVCGKEVPRRRGVPCSHVPCPDCGGLMI